MNEESNVVKPDNDAEATNCPANTLRPLVGSLKIIRGFLEEAGDCLAPVELNSEVRSGIIISASRDEIKGGQNIIFKKVVVMLASDFDALVASNDKLRDAAQ